MGIPAPSAFPNNKTSGTIFQCSNANIFPVFPIPACISSKMSNAQFSLHFCCNALRNSMVGSIYPASPWIVSIITHAVCLSIIFKLSILLNSINSTSGNRGR